MMIFGKTHDERRYWEDHIWKNPYGHWHRKFAWLPTTMSDGREVWLEDYERRDIASYYFYWRWGHIWQKRVIDKKSS